MCAEVRFRSSIDIQRPCYSFELPPYDVHRERQVPERNAPKPAFYKKAISFEIAVRFMR